MCETWASLCWLIWGAMAGDPCPISSRTYFKMFNGFTCLRRAGANLSPRLFRLSLDSAVLGSGEDNRPPYLHFCLITGPVEDCTAHTHSCAVAAASGCRLTFCSRRQMSINYNVASGLRRRCLRLALYLVRISFDTLSCGIALSASHGALVWEARRTKRKQ